MMFALLGLRRLRKLKLRFNQDIGLVTNPTLHILAAQLHALCLTELQVPKQVTISQEGKVSTILLS